MTQENRATQVVDDVPQTADTMGMINTDDAIEQNPNNQELADELSPEAQIVKLESVEESSDFLMEKVERALSRDYDFRCNVVTGFTEWRSKDWKLKKGKNKFQQLNDRKLNSIHRALNRKGLRVSVAGLRTLLASDFVSTYDPFKRYLKNLAQWDGNSDYIGILSNRVKTNDQEWWNKIFRKWFVAMVASWNNVKVVNQTALVIIGGQGIGKSTFLLNLIPDELRHYVCAKKLDPNNKDSEVQLSESGLIILDELDYYKKQDIGELKEIITKAAIKTRRPYGYHSDVLIRRASFAGTSNTEQVLDDSSGSRRFLCTLANSIEYGTYADLDKAFAQALHLCKNGFQYWFDGAEIEELSKHNEAFQSRSLAEELLSTYFVPCQVEDAEKFMNATEIAEFLVSMKKATIVNDSLLKQIGKAAIKMQFQKKKVKGGISKYAIKMVSTDTTSKE